MDAMPLACLSAATVLSVFFSRPIIRDALGADTTASGGMTKSAQKNSVADADAPGARAAARPLSRSTPRKASAVGAISASPRTHPPAGRSHTPPTSSAMGRRATPMPPLPQVSSASQWPPSCGCWAQTAVVAARDQGGVMRSFLRLRALCSAGLTLAGPARAPLSGTACSLGITRPTTTTTTAATSMALVLSAFGSRASTQSPVVTRSRYTPGTGALRTVAMRTLGKPVRKGLMAPTATTDFSYGLPTLQ